MSHPRETSTSEPDTAAWPLVVGTVHSPESLAAALALAGQTGGPDLLELRVDHFADAPEALEALTALAPRLFIVTVRGPAEGGVGELADERRVELYGRFLAVARFVDIEVHALTTLSGVVRSAREKGCTVIGSFHDFQGTPPLQALREQADRALDGGAHLLKIAAMAHNAADLAVLLEFSATETRLPLSIMGMGPFGRVSRLALAVAGSVLNYGFLGEKAQVSGQWPAALLRLRLDELLSDQISHGSNAD